MTRPLLSSPVVLRQPTGHSSVCCPLRECLCSGSLPLAVCSWSLVSFESHFRWCLCSEGFEIYVLKAELNWNLQLWNAVRIEKGKCEGMKEQTLSPSTHSSIHPSIHWSVHPCVLLRVWLSHLMACGVLHSELMMHHQTDRVVMRNHR